MNNEVKDKINDIKGTLSEISYNLLLLSDSLNKVSESIDNFSILCNTPGELVCPENFSECENNPDLCVFNHATDEDKQQICSQRPDVNQEIISKGYSYEYTKGKAIVNSTTDINKETVVGVRKGWKGDKNKLPVCL